MNLLLLALYTILFGVLGFLLGTAGSIISLLIPRLRQPVAEYFERAAATTLYRPSITFGESNDLLWKRRHYDADQGAEAIDSGGDQLELANPDSSTWSFHGSPLSIVDEFFGVVVDQRHLHPGEVLETHLRESTLWVGDYWEWINGQEFLAAPAYAPVDKSGAAGKLQAARAIFWGAEEADHPDTTKTFVAKAHEARKDSAMWKQLLIPLAFLIVAFGLMWFAAKYGGGGGSTQAPTSVGSAALLLAGIPSLRSSSDDDQDDDVDDENEDDDDGEESRDPVGWVREHKPSARQTMVGLFAIAGIGAAALVLLFLFVFFGPLGLCFVLSSFAIGFAIFPFSGPLLNKRLPTTVAERLAGLYLRLGLLPYENPDLELSSDGQQFVEGDGSGPRYRLAGQYVGFTMDSEDVEGLYGNRGVSASTVDNQDAAGGGEVSNVPSDYVESDAFTFGRVKGYIPEDPDEEYRYVRLDRIMAPFEKVNIGQRSQKALETAKEEFGAGWQDLNTKQILWMSLGMAVLGLGMGYVVFFGL